MYITQRKHIGHARKTRHLNMRQIFSIKSTYLPSLKLNVHNYEIKTSPSSQIGDLLCKFKISLRKNSKLRNIGYNAYDAYSPIWMAAQRTRAIKRETKMPLC